MGSAATTLPRRLVLSVEVIKILSQIIVGQLQMEREICVRHLLLKAQKSGRPTASDLHIKVRWSVFTSFVVLNTSDSIGGFHLAPGTLAFH